VRSSRHIFQQTHRRRIPPASRTEYLQQLHRYAGEYDSQSGRSKNSYDDHPPALLRRQTDSSKGNNDRIVSSQYQVDHNDLY
jgi:hypothetical protein